MDTQFTQLTDFQIAEIVGFITEDHGSGMGYDDFSDLLLEMMEDVALVPMDQEQEERLLKRAFEIYQQPTE